MDAGTIAAIAAPFVAFGGGIVAIVKILVDRHLAALTRLETRAEANTEVQQGIALAMDAVRDHLVDLRRTGDRTARQVERITDHLGMPEHEHSAPMPPPPDVPRASTITGRYRAVTAERQSSPDTQRKFT